MHSHLIRSTFLNYFRNKGHRVTPSSSLVPAEDPTLLFTNSGMVQFKDVFLGARQLDYSQAVTAQRCLRAGGKHNDLDNVGYTARHHTFFEMLGNFSFGDYFKDKAIAYAWEFVTKVLKLPEERLWVTIHHQDDASEAIWLNDIKVSPERFSRLNESNFWQMGEAGPCGPCSEIFYDHGPEVEGGPPGTPEEDGDRYVEIWNLVFMQYQREADGKLTELTRPSIDTGMGLERIAAVMQGVVSNYATDLFVPLIEAACRATGCARREHPSVQVIADHLRSSCFLLLDGVTPSNEGRGYVLRRIIRRAIRHGHSLGCDQAFFHSLVPVLVETMGKAMPELVRNQARIQKTLEHEEAQFQRTLSHGMAELEKGIAGIRGSELPGELLFRLYDTFGFPVDMVGDIARERELTLDLTGFEREMTQQREQSRSSADFASHRQELKLQGSTSFTGYTHLSGEAQISYLLHQEDEHTTLVDGLRSGQKGVVVLDATPFYAESGGQVGDTGLLETPSGRFVVKDTRKVGNLFWHVGYMQSGELAGGEEVRAEVDAVRRASIMRNHSATHLLHAALRQVLGEGVMQRGSLVNHQRLRFDFSHTNQVGRDELNAISSLVNEQIVANLPVAVEEMSISEATHKGALAFFEEKYGDQVRVLSMGANKAQGAETGQAPYSVELCGGTHVARTGDIGCFHIIAESGIASGVRRIEALTGKAAIEHLQAQAGLLADLSVQVKTSSEQLPAAIAGLQQQLVQQKRELATLEARLATAGGGDGGVQPETLGDFQAIVRRLDDASPGAMSRVIDTYIARLGNRGAVVLAGGFQDKVVLAAGVTGEAKDRLHAGKMLAALAPLVSGKAGGKPTFAQGGGTDQGGMDKLLAEARATIAAA